MFTLFIILSLFAACANNSRPASGEGEKEGMAQFADDKEFQDKHEEPDSLDMTYRGEMVEFSTPDGKTGSAYALLPEGGAEKYLFVIHEWWGLNDHIKKEAERLYDSLGVGVLALDLYDGKVADNREDASEYMKSVQEDRARAIIQGAMNTYATDGAPVATVGWCFGGGWSLQASILAGKQGAGCVIYYGMPVKEAQALVPLEADILGIFAKQDAWITPEVVNEFENLAKATGKDIKVHQFDADHAFANPSNPNYDKESSQEAFDLTLDFLRERL
jgi:carboxymethylenebutenolidase